MGRKFAIYCAELGWFVEKQPGVSAVFSADLSDARLMNIGTANATKAELTYTDLRSCFAVVPVNLEAVA